MTSSSIIKLMQLFLKYEFEIPNKISILYTGLFSHLVISALLHLQTVSTCLEIVYAVVFEDR